MREHFTRRNLPHWYMPAATHFITFRLAGTLPKNVLTELSERKYSLLQQRPVGLSLAQHRQQVHKLIFAKYDDFLATATDIHWLDKPQIAQLVQSSIYYGHNKTYGLLAYCIMPNHVHLLIRPFGVAPGCEFTWENLDPGETPDHHSPLTKIMHSLKSYTAHQANRILNRSGQFWQHESYDHWVRDDDELERIVSYINDNPVRAGLVSRAVDYPYCSARDRFLQDGDPSGWLPLNFP